MKKKILAVALAATMVVASAFNAFAADTITSDEWWTTSPTSTAVSIADGETVTFSVDITSDTLADGDYAAFCVEANDGTYYFTATSDGGAWGGTDLADPATTATSTGAVVGGSYTVTISRSGNNWTCDVADSTGTSLFTNEVGIEGTCEFGDTTCYIMAQVGTLTVDVVTDSSASADDTEDETTTEAAADTEDETTTEAAADETTTTAAATTETGDVATFASIAIVAAAAVAIVALRKRVTE